MNVYTVYVGHSYESGNIGGVFTNPSTAHDFANLMIRTGFYTRVRVEEFTLDSLRGGKELPNEG